MIGATCLAWAIAAALAAAEPAIRSDHPNVVSFPAQEARFVRFLIHGSSASEPCIDELEVYGADDRRNLALASGGAKASASSCLTGYRQHAIEHLNDGQYGNDFSWIAATSSDEWAQIELPKPATVSKVVFSRDRNREYADRVPVNFEVQLSTDGKQWTTVKKVAGKAAPVVTRRRSLDNFAAVLPNPPPPPVVGKQGNVLAPETTPDLKIAQKDALGFANLALNAQAKPSASSLLPGHAIHQIAHLRDGLAGNSHSWISAADPSWAEIDLGEVHWVYNVAFGSDGSRQYQDRAATSFVILTATEYHQDTAASTWKPIVKQSRGTPIHARTEFKFKPVQARWVRIAVDATTGGQARIDEIEIYGQKEPIPPEKIGPVREAALAQDKAADTELLQYAALGEEHAWLKTYGRADISPHLVPYNGRVKEYPRHVGDDRVPLPPLSSPPALDGALGDPCWAEASQGAARVAHPYDFDRSPLVSHEVLAGWKGEDLFVGLRIDRLLSSHVAVVSASDGDGCGVVAVAKEGLIFNTYEAEGPQGIKLKQSTPIPGAFSKDLGCFEFRLPLALLPDCRAKGVRIGVGMGGKHTPPSGRPVSFVFSPLAVAQVGPCVNRTFRVRLAVAPGAGPVRLRGNAPELADGLTLAAGQSKTIAIQAERGAIGPEYKLTVEEEGGPSHVLHLFRYDPLERTLSLMDEMLGRFAAKGLDVAGERGQWAGFRQQQERLLAAAPDLAAERQAFFEARLAKRLLLLREPELGPIEKILFVHRQAYRPSHNYSVMLDAPWRPGGDVSILHIPRLGGRFEPAEAEISRLFDSGQGIARDPMADFEAKRIYFAHRASEPEYFHVMRMNVDGTGLKQLTDGPFHDYWPCPLPDGGLAMISSRCRARYLCWRPQVSVLFRMEADGEDIRPLSFANLSEWGPSVMSDGRIIWQRSEYIDKGADFSHTLWAIRPDGTKPELIFGNTIIQPNGYANGREVPGTHEICCTLISHFGDLNGPIALLDLDKGRFDPKAITSITPEVPWPGMWPAEECFRDPVPLARDYVLCAHAPRDRFGIYVIDRFGNRELLHLDHTICSMTPTPLRPVKRAPVLFDEVRPEQPEEMGQFTVADVYRGIAPTVPRGTVKYLRVVEEVRAGLEQMPNGEYRKDHEPFTFFYATPVDRVSGPFGWTSYVAKASWGLAPVEEDGSASFCAPAGRQLYFQALDKDFNELQRMRSVVQLQPGEKRSCIGCHEDRRHAPTVRPTIALRRPPHELEKPSWGTGPLSYEREVQPIWDAKCARCHDQNDKQKINLTGTLDNDRVPASYRTLISQGWLHYLDCGYNSGGNEKREPLTFGTLQSKLWKVLDAGHYEAKLTRDEIHRIKCWTDMNCPLWPDYIDRTKRQPVIQPRLAPRPIGPGRRL